MPTEINWPIFSSREMRRSSLSAHFSASFDGFREYGLTDSGAGAVFAEAGAAMRTMPAGPSKNVATSNSVVRRTTLRTVGLALCLITGLTFFGTKIRLLGLCQ